MDPSQPRLTVAVVGAGRVGAVLGAALQRAGHAVVAVVAVSDASLGRARVLLPGVPVREAPEAVAEADLALLAVPDDMLPGLVRGLAAAGAFHPGQIVVHTSAQYGIGVLEPASHSDVLPVALNPAMAFAGTASDVGRLSECLFAVTTIAALRPLGEALAIEMGGEPVWIEEEDRPAYAAALGAVRDGVAGVCAAAARVLLDCGIEHPGRALGPLVRSTVDGILGAGSVTHDRAAPAVDDEESP